MGQRRRSLAVALLAIAFVLYGCSSSPPAESADGTVENHESVRNAAHQDSTQSEIDGNSSESPERLGYQLNSWSWNYEPWMEEFVRQLHQHWVAPPSYRWGVVSGYTTLRVVVDRDGIIESVEVLEKEGHNTLHRSSVDAVEGIEQLPPLGEDFVEEHLEIKATLKYPEYKR
jgi:hypothetical protein